MAVKAGIQFTVDKAGNLQVFEQLRKDVKRLNEETRRSTNELKRIRKASTSTEATIRKLGGAFKYAGGAFGAYFGARQISSSIQEIVRLGNTVNGVEAAFKSTFGSTEAAANELQFLRDEAERTGSEFFALADGYKLWSAAAERSSLAGQEQRKIFQSVTETMRVMNLSTDDSKGVLRAFTQVLSKGKVQAEELRGQIGERVPGAFMIAARSMGYTGEQLNKLMEDGKLYSEDFLPKFAQALREEFGGGFDEAANNLQSNINKMNNQFSYLKLGMFDKIEEPLTKIVVSITEVTRAINTMTDSEFDQYIKVVTAGFGALAAVMTVRVLSAFVANTSQSILYQAALARMAGLSYGAATAQGALAIGLGSVAAASRAATAALTLLGGWLGVFAIAATGVYIYRQEIYELATVTGQMEKLQRQHNEVIEESIKAAYDYADANDEARAAIKKRQMATIEAAKADLAAISVLLEKKKALLDVARVEDAQNSDNPEYQSMEDTRQREYSVEQEKYTKSSEHILELTKNLELLGKSRYELDKITRKGSEGIRSNTKETSKNTKETDKNNKKISEAEKLRRKIQDSYKRELASLTDQKNKLTLSEEQYYRSTLAAKGFSEEMINVAAAAWNQNAAIERQTELHKEATKKKLEVDKEYKKLRDELLSANDSDFDAFKKRLADKSITGDQAKDLSSLFNQNQFEELEQQYQTEYEKLENSYAKKKEIILRNTRDTESARQSLLEKLDREYSDKRREYMTEAAQSLSESLLSVTSDMAGKQSGIYKVMFAASKAFSIADSIMKIQQGIANAAAVPFPANIAAMATVAAATANIVGTIKQVKMQSFAKGGLVRSRETFMNGGAPAERAEAGAEYIMPAKRLSGGEMGVKAVAVPAVNNLTFLNAPPIESQTVTENETGGADIETIFQQFDGRMAQGVRAGDSSFDAAMSAKYGLRKAASI